MSLSLKLSLKVGPALTCPVCGNERNAQEIADDITTVLLFGAVPYAQCPACKRAVSRETMHDRGYRTRARVRMFSDTGQVWRADPVIDGGNDATTGGWSQRYSKKGGARQKGIPSPLKGKTRS